MGLTSALGPGLGLWFLKVHRLFSGCHATGRVGTEANGSPQEPLACQTCHNEIWALRETAGHGTG